MRSWDHYILGFFFCSVSFAADCTVFFIDHRCSVFSARVTIPRFLSPMECIKCNQPLPSDGRFLTCVYCRNGYHLGKPCSGVSDTTFMAMGAARRESWRCPTCRTGELRSGSGACGGNTTDDSARPDSANGSRSQTLMLLVNYPQLNARSISFSR